MSGGKPKNSNPCACGGQFGVVDSRPSCLPGFLIRRRLKCRGCGKRMTTHEIVVSDALSDARSEIALVMAHDRAVAAVNAALGVLLDGLPSEDVAAIRKSLAGYEWRGTLEGAA